MKRKDKIAMAMGMVSWVLLLPIIGLAFTAVFNATVTDQQWLGGWGLFIVGVILMMVTLEELKDE